MAAPEEWQPLTFDALRAGRYPAYDAVREAAAAGGNRGTVVNAADEVAVAAFLLGALPFTGIPTTITHAVDRWGSDAEPNLEEIVALDAEVRGALESELGIGEAA
jgi:1-deoxy-D-xylulose-5-phosphate reductoisomerase